MTEHSVTHATFVIERTYDVSPARVFAAWADPAIKARWFGGPEDWASGKHKLDFRVGGRETFSGGAVGGTVHSYIATIADIVPEQRIVSTYEMQQDGTRTSVSVATVELTPHDGGTRLKLTEQGAYLDGLDKVEWREHGTGELLDALATVLAGATAKA
jgi:uncharacterized protein YndB with AHSA1/START domain